MRRVFLILRKRGSPRMREEAKRPLCGAFSFSEWGRGENGMDFGALCPLAIGRLRDGRIHCV